MSHSARAVFAITLLMLAGARVPSAASAQQTQPPDGWAFGVGGLLIHFSDAGDISNLGGPAVQISRVTPRGLGFDARLGYIMPTGFYSFTGLTGLAGLSYGVPAGSHLLLLKGGVTGFLGGDSDGTGVAAGGPYFGAGMVLRLSARAGLQLDGLLRFYSGTAGGVAPSVGAALVILPAGP